MFASVSKARAATATVTMSVITVLILVVTQGQGVCCTFPFLVNIAIFGFIWYRYWAMDRRILEIKQEEEAHAFSRTEPQHAVLPPQASKGSNGQLFIPPPLDSGRTP